MSHPKAVQLWRSPFARRYPFFSHASPRPLGLGLEENERAELQRNEHIESQNSQAAEAFDKASWKGMSFPHVSPFFLALSLNYMYIIYIAGSFMHE